MVVSLKADRISFYSVAAHCIQCCRLHSVWYTALNVAHCPPELDVPVPGIPGIGNFSFFWWYRNRYRKKLVPEKSLGTGIGKIWYRKKVSEPVSEKFSTGKSLGTGIGKILVPEKVWELESNIFGTKKNLVPILQFCFPCLNKS